MDKKQYRPDTVNPIRYRGYYYDTETGLYYLQSRYYNPEWGRFLNADDMQTLTLSQDDILVTNLFAYCVNNPVNNSDPSGYFAQMVIGAFVGALLGAVGGALDQLLSYYFKHSTFNGFKIRGRKLTIAALSGAVTGALGGATCAKAVQAVINGLATYIGTRASGNTILESVIATLISVLIFKVGMGKQFGKLNMKKINSGKIRSMAKALSYYIKSNSTLYKKYLSRVVKGSIKDWFFAFGLNRIYNKVAQR
ncbi:hypothetical protein SDC9_109248 [bioreactor metagenome]|uniref:Uncharacterized protein n=1 Tax=bioreactor metagenome TaxID=1076179 RepID=A0A645BAE4_9ZZZZ